MAMREYYKRFMGEVLKDLSALTRKEAVLSTIAAIIGVPVGVWVGSVSRVQAPPAIITVLCVFGVIFIIRLGIAIICTPVRLEQAKLAEFTEKAEWFRRNISDLRTASHQNLASKQARIEELESQLAPERERRAFVEKQIADFTEAERVFLRWHAQVRKAAEPNYYECGLPKPQWEGAVGKMRSRALFHDEGPPRPHSRQRFTVINEDLREAILFLTRPVTPSVDWQNSRAS